MRPMRKSRQAARYWVGPQAMINVKFAKIGRNRTLIQWQHLFSKYLAQTFWNRLLSVLRLRGGSRQAFAVPTVCRAALWPSRVPRRTLPS